MENNHSATRAARRFLAERVRTDWDWPNPPPCWSASDEEVRSVTVFRERFYGDSSPSSGSDDDNDASNTENPYKFDNPDSVGGMVERKVERKKRKRDQRLRDEMKENEGLRIFVARRDRWTGADAVRRYKAKPSTGTSAHSPTSPSTDDKTTSSERKQDDADASEKTTVIPDSSTGGSGGGGDKTPTSVQGESPKPSPTSDTPPTNIHATPASIPPTSNTLIPVAPPLLPTNPIRASITSKTYPDIYSKIVLQSLAPAVPINLADMTKALVQGWREHGEWPPKQAALDPLPGGKKRGGLGGLGFGFGLGGHGNNSGRTDAAKGGGHGENAGAGGSGVAAGEGGDAFLAHHPHLQKGVGGLRRMLHLNGHTSPSGAAAVSPTTPTSADSHRRGEKGGAAAAAG